MQISGDEERSLYFRVSPISNFMLALHSLNVGLWSDHVASARPSSKPYIAFKVGKWTKFLFSVHYKTIIMMTKEQDYFYFGQRLQSSFHPNTTMSNNHSQGIPQGELGLKWHTWLGNNACNTAPQMQSDFEAVAFAFCQSALWKWGSPNSCPITPTSTFFQHKTLPFASGRKKTSDLEVV